MKVLTMHQAVYLGKLQSKKMIKVWPMLRKRLKEIGVI